MTQEDKELLIKDLSARLSYGVKINNEIQGDFAIYGICENYVFARTTNTHADFTIEKIKQYLFPLSSMTEEQEDEWYDVFSAPLSKTLDRHTRQEYLQFQADAQTFGIEYLLKNHFDYRGLIEKGLAIDATNLNIYIDLLKL